jgi:hypothetical protein
MHLFATMTPEQFLKVGKSGYAEASAQTLSGPPLTAAAT